MSKSKSASWIIEAADDYREDYIREIEARGEAEVAKNLLHSGFVPRIDIKHYWSFYCRN